MSIDDLEASVDGGSPRELFLFQQGATSWAFSGADEDVVYMDRTFTRDTIICGEVDQSQEEDSGHVNVRCPATNPVAAQFVGIPPTIPIYVTVYRVHRTGVAAVRFMGRIVQATVDGPEATLECAPLSGALSRQIPSLSYQRECNWPLYGIGCTVNRELFKTTAVLDGVSGFSITSATFATKPDGWFTFGYLEVAGDRRAITAHVGATLTVSSPFRSAGAGDTAFAFAGCDKKETTCAVKFDNLVNHLGFARIPDRNPHDGRMA